MSLTQADFNQLYHMHEMYKRGMISRAYVEQELGIAPKRVKLWLARRN